MGQLEFHFNMRLKISFLTFWLTLFYSVLSIKGDYYALLTKMPDSWNTRNSCTNRPLRSLSIYRHFYSCYPQAWCGRAEKNTVAPILMTWKQYAIGSFSTKGAQVCLSEFFLLRIPSFLTPCRILSPPSGILFYVSVLLSGPRVTENLVPKHSCWWKNSENFWIFFNFFFIA